MNVLRTGDSLKADVLGGKEKRRENVSFKVEGCLSGNNISRHSVGLL